MSFDEQFQNVTLYRDKATKRFTFRVFKNYILKRKNVFYELHRKTNRLIDHAIHKDMKFRNSVKGMIIGQFSIDEYAKYTSNSSALNKRMMNLVMQRLIDQLQLLQVPLELRVS